jgi:PAS domain-containing protein
MINTLTASLSSFTGCRTSLRATPDLPTLRDTSERFRLLLENSVDLIVETTRQGEILYVSPNVAKVLVSRNSLFFVS